MIGKSLADFLQEGLAMHIGTCNERLEPSGVRATAVKVEDDGTHLTVYVPQVVVQRILPDLESTGRAAVVFCRPTDDRSCQVKGVFTGARAAGVRERPLVTAQWEGFRRSLEAIGIPRVLFDRWVTWPSVAVRLRATALFNQTPGPGAGGPLA